MNTPKPQLIGNGIWQRVIAADQVLLSEIRERTGADPRLGESAVRRDGNGFAYLAAKFVERDGSDYRETKIIIAVSDQTVITFEPHADCAPIELALKRVRQLDDAHAFVIVAAILQALSDATDSLISWINQTTERTMIQTNNILRSLETKKSRDFGISDVTDTQQQLADTEELLSRCMHNQLELAETARMFRSKLPEPHAEARDDLDRLIDDLNATEHSIEFVHDRVRLLQQSNNLALNVKQNQIIKVFSVVTAVFLPVMLLSTYYSMNFEFMPILAWKYAEPAMIVLSFAFAMMPLIYVRRRGWLR